MKLIESAALLVRSVPYGESDLVVTFFTETDGKVGAVVRGARRSVKRFGGALEPIHELFVRLEDKGRELCTLKEARIERPRHGAVSSLEAMEAAGLALRWVRHLCPTRTPELKAWTELRRALDALDATGTVRETPHPARELLVGFGIRLLGEMGYGLDFERCVRCGKACPEGRPAFIDAAGGGLVCMNCGGARRTISAEMRGLAMRARRLDGVAATPPNEGQVSELLAIVEDAMIAHADFDPSRRPHD